MNSPTLLSSGCLVPVPGGNIRTHAPRFAQSRGGDEDLFGWPSQYVYFLTLMIEPTCGRPPDPWTLTPPLPSAVTLLQLKTSTSSSLALYPASGTDQDGEDELPPLVRRASVGGLEMAMVEDDCETNFNYDNQSVRRIWRIGRLKQTAVVW